MGYSTPDVHLRGPKLNGLPIRMSEHSNIHETHKVLNLERGWFKSNNDGTGRKCKSNAMRMDECVTSKMRE